MANRPPHIVYGYKWVLCKDVQGKLRQILEEEGIAGQHLVGYPYVDHTAGFSMHIHLFCEVSPLGEIGITANYFAQKKSFILRWSLLETYQITPLTPSQIATLQLPTVPEHIRFYEAKEVEPLRSLELLHPLRAPGFPDDIWFVMAQEGKQPEQVWGRLERQVGEHLFECVLLNQPHQNFGVKVGDLVIVAIAPVGDNIGSQFVGPA